MVCLKGSEENHCPAQPHAPCSQERHSPLQGDFLRVRWHHQVHCSGLVDRVKAFTVKRAAFWAQCHYSLMQALGKSLNPMICSESLKGGERGTAELRHQEVPFRTDEDGGGGPSLPASTVPVPLTFHSSSFTGNISRPILTWRRTRWSPEPQNSHTTP